MPGPGFSRFWVRCLCKLHLVCVNTVCRRLKMESKHYNNREQQSCDLRCTSACKRVCQRDDEGSLRSKCPLMILCLCPGRADSRKVCSSWNSPWSMKRISTLNGTELSKMTNYLFDYSDFLHVLCQAEWRAIRDLSLSTENLCRLDQRKIEMKRADFS